MAIDLDLLKEFEAGLDPAHPEKSTIPAELKGYGEISAIFRIGPDTDTVYKRMPLFKDVESAKKYEAMYLEYCDLLGRAGLRLPETGTAVVQAGHGPVVLYISQACLSQIDFAHYLIHGRSIDDTKRMLSAIMAESGKIWQFTREQGPDLEIAIDGQLSNWVFPSLDEPPFYVDTSTPLFKKKGIHLLDPDLLLQAAPGFLRWILKVFFAREVLNRYFDPRKNMIDLAANLYKEQRPDLIPPVIEAINQGLPQGVVPLDEGAVKSYYREDKFIWNIFLTFRRLDRWIKTRVTGRRYEFILPGKIKR